MEYEHNVMIPNRGSLHEPLGYHASLSSRLEWSLLCMTVVNSNNLLRGNLNRGNLFNIA